MRVQVIAMVGKFRFIATPLNVKHCIKGFLRVENHTL
jgi:hypothetical protein